MPATPGPVLREVVYSFSYSESYDATYGSYGANAPETSYNGGGYNGTMVVDVVGVGNDGSLDLHITQTTDAENDRTPTDAEFLIRPDGGLGVLAGKYTDPMMKLAPYFGTAYFAGHDLQQGSAWTTESDLQQYHITTSTTVSKVDGDLATIDSVMKETATQLHGHYSGTSSLVYDAPLLVPASLDIQLYSLGQDLGSNGESRAHFHFDRKSDTRQPKG